MARIDVTGCWSGNGEQYRTRGARCFRIAGQGWFVSIENTNKFRGPFANAISAMESADRMLAEAERAA